MNILFIGAHHDDLEIGIGGSVRKWVTEGHQVYSVILTNSKWTAPDGSKFRFEEDIVSQCDKASKILGYEPYNFDVCDALQLKFSDDIVKDLLKIIIDKKIDFLVTHWPYDAHPDHQVTSNLALAASRKIPRILLTKISMNSVLHPYKPNYFVDISDTISYKYEAIKFYTSEYKRKGEEWKDFIHSSAKYYGIECNYKFAEAFEIVKYVY
jgi:N-acetylglucosamine malate deacetylase 1